MDGGARGRLACAVRPPGVGRDAADDRDRRGADSDAASGPAAVVDPYGGARRIPRTKHPRRSGSGAGETGLDGARRFACGGHVGDHRPLACIRVPARLSGDRDPRPAVRPGCVASSRSHGGRSGSSGRGLVRWRRVVFPARCARDSGGGACVARRRVSRVAAARWTRRRRSGPRVDARRRTAGCAGHQPRRDHTHRARYHRRGRYGPAQGRAIRRGACGGHAGD